MRAEVERGNVKETRLQEVCGLDSGVVWHDSLKRGDGGENGGMIDKVLVRGDSQKSLVCFRDGAPLVMVVVGDNEILVGVLRGQVPNAIRDGVRVKEVVGDVFKGGAIFLFDFLGLFNLNFNRGKGC